MAGVGASEGIGEDELPFRSGDTVFLRLNLQPSDGPGPDLLRGTSGEVTEVRSSDDTVLVRFGPIRVRCRTDWLESAPEQIIVLTDTSLSSSSWDTDCSNKAAYGGPHPSTRRRVLKARRAYNKAEVERIQRKQASHIV